MDLSDLGQGQIISYYKNEMFQKQISQKIKCFKMCGANNFQARQKDKRCKEQIEKWLHRIVITDLSSLS